MRDVIEQGRWWRNGIIQWGWVEVGLLMLLLLSKDIDGVLQLREPCSLPIDMLPPSFDTLSDCLVPHNRLLFLLEPLYILLDPNQFFLFYDSFDFLDFLIPVLHLGLIELEVAMDDLKW
jgi:hypothetical protein